MATAIEQALSLVEKRDNPVGHPHPPGKYVSMSQLAAYPATEIARRMIEQDYPNVDKYYTYRGDAMAYETFHPSDGWAQEIHVRVDIGNGWEMTGTMDAVQAFGNGVVVGEKKVHNGIGPWHIEKAKRQALGYLAMLYHKSKSGSYTLEPSEWASTKEKFTWKDGYVPAGVLVSIATGPPVVREGYEVTPDMLDEVFEFYRELALTVAHCVETGDLTKAQEWDAEHEGFVGDDYYTTFGEPRSDLEEITSRIGELAKEKRWVEAEHKRYRKKLEKKLKEHGLWEKVQTEGVVVNDIKVSVHQRGGYEKADLNALKRDGLEAYITQGTPYEVMTVRGS